MEQFVDFNKLIQTHPGEDILQMIMFLFSQIMFSWILKFGFTPF